MYRKILKTATYKRSTLLHALLHGRWNNTVLTTFSSIHAAKAKCEEWRKLYLWVLLLGIRIMT